MEFPNELHLILETEEIRHKNDNDGSSWSNSASSSSFYESILDWNNRIEVTFNSRIIPSSSSNNDNHETRVSMLNETASLLHRFIVTVSTILGNTNEGSDDGNGVCSPPSIMAVESCDDEANNTAEQTASALNLPNCGRTSDDDDDDDDEYDDTATTSNNHYYLLLAELLRISKNLLRWKSQILLSQHPHSEKTMQRLVSYGMLSLYLKLIQTSTFSSVARYASLTLFYATFNPNNNDQDIKSLQTTMIDNLDGATVFMKVLVLLPSSSMVSLDLILSIIRHVHNLVASLKEKALIQMDNAIQSIVSSIMTTTSSNSPEVSSSSTSDNRNTISPAAAPWIADCCCCDDDNDERHSLNLVTVLARVADWCLNDDENDKANELPLFPGNPGDRRTDIVIEISRIFFVLRVAATKSNETTASLFQRLVVRILTIRNNDRAAASSSSTSTLEDPRVYQCQLASVSLLMDAPHQCGDWLIEYDCMDTLLQMLQTQVSEVVDRSGSGPTKLMPILVVLKKFASTNSKILKSVKEFIFPLDAETDTFQPKAKAEMGKCGHQGLGAKNMAPLDAPKGSLRWKLIRLMTWTESYTKRATGELLWTLCGNDPREFVLRTGFGNALPLLSLKGHIQLPAGAT